MPLTVTEVEELRAYLSGVMNRADHHAGRVNEIALALAGAILWRKSDEHPIKVMAMEGQTKTYSGQGSAIRNLRFRTIMNRAKSKCGKAVCEGRRCIDSTTTPHCRRYAPSLKTFNVFVQPPRFDSALTGAEH